jgi:hypothetical protein
MGFSSIINPLYLAPAKPGSAPGHHDLTRFVYFWASPKYPGGNWTPGQITAIAAAVTSATGTSGIAATPAPSQVCGCPDGCFSAKTGQSVDCGGAPASGVPGKAGTPFRGIDSTPGLTSPLNEVITAWTP